MQTNERPFAKFIEGFFIFWMVFGFLALTNIRDYFPNRTLFLSNLPFFIGIYVSVGWALLSYFKNLDLPAKTHQARSEKTILGLFLLLVGIIFAGITPYYLSGSIDSRIVNWVIILGYFLGAQIGLSLLLSEPLGSLSFWCGYLSMAIFLHSDIQSVSKYVDGTELIQAKILVLVCIILSSWFLGLWLFENNTELKVSEESTKSKHAKSIIGIFGGLLTVIEFINIMYTIINLK